MRFYFSHSIRGKYGKDATSAQMKKNCDKAILIVNVLRATFPSQEFYIPAEHEDFVGIAYHEGYLTERQVLDVDCKIIDNCEGVIIYVPEDDKLQGGRLVEYDYAKLRGKFVFIFSGIEDIINRLAQYILRS